MAPPKRGKIKPARVLGDKVPKTGGPSPEQAITRALRMGEQLIDSYQGWAVDDLQALWEESKSLTPQGAVAKIHIQKLYNMSHEIRGQGGTFKFSLISVLGDSLCKYLENRETLDHRGLDIIRLHILAMKAVFRQELKGDQKELGAQLGELLHTLRSQ